MRLTDPESAERVVALAREAGSVAIDTEFMREKTYWARLCLVQVGVGDQAWILDPLEGGDLEWLQDLFDDESIVKVLHAGQQDLEIVTRALGRPPRPVFDTQVAATLAGFPSQVGYARMIKDLFDVDLDKSDTFTDWARRPLTPNQVEYALNDVRHLTAAYTELCARLSRDDRLSWVESDFEQLSDPDAYRILPEEQWRRVKRHSTLNRRGLGVLREVAAWRETAAQTRDLPRRWIVSDESLLEIARRRPADAAALGQIRGVNPRALGGGGAGLLEAVRRGERIPDDQLPRLEKRRRAVVDVEGAVELMGALVRVRAAEHGVAVPLLASRTDLEHLASGEREDSPLLGGWRRRLVGDELIDLLEGRLSLHVGDGGIVVERIGTADAADGEGQEAVGEP